MTLRERRKGNGYDEEVTPPPTVSRRGRGTPRGKAVAPTTPLARKAGQTKMASPINAEDLSTPTAQGRPDVGSLPSDSPSTLPRVVVEERKVSHPAATTYASVAAPVPPPVVDAPEVKPEEPQTAGSAKIMLRFARPPPLPPAELTSLPSPITPLPPSQSSLYPLLPHLTATSDHLTIDQRLAYQEGSASTATSDDYLSARSAPTDGDRQAREATGESTSTTGSGPHMPGGLQRP